MFQLGIFLRALRPVRTVLRPARLSSALPELFEKKKKINFSIFIYLQNVIAVFVFSDSRCKNACNCLQICAHVFIDRPQNCALLGHSRSKLCPILCRLCTKLCPNFGRSRARLCPISFPNLAETLITGNEKHL